MFPVLSSPVWHLLDSYSEKKKTKKKTRINYKNNVQIKSIIIIQSMCKIHLLIFILKVPFN